MGLFSKIFGNRTKDSSTRHDWPEEYKRVQDFNDKLALLLGRDRFIAKSDYASIVSEYSELPIFFGTLEKSGMLSSYAETNGLDNKTIKEFRCTYSQLSDITGEPVIIKAHNDAFIQRQLKEQKKYLDNILKECDPNIMLDAEQREVVLSDEDHTLVIAGAGAGKTTTVAAKVRFLVEKQGIRPEEILVISFTNKAVNELKDRINHSLNIPCTISTFHSIGNSIMNTHEDGRKRIVDNG